MAAAITAPGEPIPLAAALLTVKTAAFVAAGIIPSSKASTILKGCTAIPRDGAVVGEIGFRWVTPLRLGSSLDP